MSLRLVTQGYQAGKNTLLEPTEFILEAGLTVILGPNGAGKSTLLSMLSGELCPIGTTVKLSQHALLSLSLQQRAQRLAMLTQTQPLAFDFSLDDVIAMGCSPLGLAPFEIEQKVSNLMNAMELSSHQGQPYPTLSGGEQQRVQLARTLAQVGEDTQVLLLDEPLAAMDLRHQHSVMRLLKSYAQNGLIVVAVLHDAELAARYADQLILLKAGGVLAQGAVQRVWQSKLLSELYDMPLEARFVDEAYQLRVL